MYFIVEMRVSFCIVFILLIQHYHQSAFCQLVAFQKTFGAPSYGAGASIQQTIDGSYIILGATHVNGNSDLYIIRIDQAGDTLWSKIYEITGGEIACSISEMHDGGLIVTATNSSGGLGQKDILLIRLDSNGDLIWTKSYGGTLDDLGVAAKETYDHGFIIIGNTLSFSWDSLYSDAYVIKVDSAGNEEWSRVICGTYWEAGFAIDQTLDSGFIITVNSESSFGGNSFILLKLNLQGNHEWDLDYGDLPNYGYGYGHSVEQLADGGFIVGGTSYFAGPLDPFIARFDSIGSFLWGSLLSDSLRDGGYSLTLCSDGGFVLSGFAQKQFPQFEDAFLSKFDANGNLLWTRTYGGGQNERAYSVIQSPDEGFILTGFSSSFNNGDIEIYVVKTDSLGNSFCFEDSISFYKEPLNLTGFSGSICYLTVQSSITSLPIQVSSLHSMSEICSFNGIAGSSGELESVFIFPNPFTSNITIAKTGYLEVFDSIGSKVLSATYEENESLDLGFLPNGIYLYKIDCANKIVCGKLIKL